MASSRIRPKQKSSDLMIERPSSGLTRGVLVTDYEEFRVNPDPIATDETDTVLNEYLSPRKLRDLTGFDDLEKVTFIKMIVDTTDSSLGNFGVHVPNLQYLKLNDSRVEHIRNLGSSLGNLKVLWLARSELRDLGGLSTMINLQELYLAFNDIEDLSPLSMLEFLKILDLEGNNVQELHQVEHLKMCPNLTSLTLQDNPICEASSLNSISNSFNYRESIHNCLPQLELLDEKVLTFIKSNNSDCDVDEHISIQADLDFMQSLKDEGYFGAREAWGNTSDSSRPGTASRPTSELSSRPKSARLTTALRPTTGIMRPYTSNRPGTSSSGGRPSSCNDDDDSIAHLSTLTSGSIVCGNPSKALRRREPIKIESNDMTNVFNDDALDDKDVEKCINDWKENSKKIMEKYERENAPKILKINHDDENVDENIDSSENITDSELEDSDLCNYYQFDSSINSAKKVLPNIIQCDNKLEKSGLIESLRSENFDVIPVIRAANFSPESPQKPPSNNGQHLNKMRRRIMPLPSKHAISPKSSYKN